MTKRKDLGIDIAYIAPRDPKTIPNVERVKYAERVYDALEDIHKMFPKYESHIFLSALINSATIGAVAVEMDIEDLLRFTATCYQNALKSKETAIDKE